MEPQFAAPHGKAKGVIITGGAKRIGAALARHLAAHGYDIALHYHHSQAEAQALQREIEALGRACLLWQQDAEDVAAMAAELEQLRQSMPQAVALINNASVFERASFMETDEALFEREMAINFTAPFFLTQAFAKHYGKGAVINMLDSNIVQTQGGHFAYLLAKKALAEFTVMAARALGPKICVNGVCPGCVLPADEADAAYVEKIRDSLPLKRHPGPEHVAEAARWLIEQQFITGQLLYVDGGMHVL